MALKSAAEEARHLVVANSLPPEEALARAVDEIVEGDPALIIDETNIHSRARAELFAFGKLQPLLDDESIEEIWINEPSRVFVAKAGISYVSDVRLSDGELRGIVERMLRSTGRRLDRSSPFVDASLQDGSRLHAVIPDITRSNWSINIRKFPKQVYNLATLTALGSIKPNQAFQLLTAVKERKNILVSGATQAGKTTLLCALIEASPIQDRIITVEETFEIRTSHPDWVAMQTRQSNLEGRGEVTLRRLIKEALRMRPARIVVGEVREAESLDLLIALNSGLPGMCTIHANSAAEAIDKLCTLPLLAGNNISSDFVRPTVAKCIDLVVHCEMGGDGNRRVKEIREVHWDEQNSIIQVSEQNYALV
ncbi:MAG: CpaF family protein [Rhodoluna sp.]